MHWSASAVSNRPELIRKRWKVTDGARDLRDHLLPPLLIQIKASIGRLIGLHLVDLLLCNELGTTRVHWKSSHTAAICGQIFSSSVLARFESALSY